MGVYLIHRPLQYSTAGAFLNRLPLPQKISKSSPAGKVLDRLCSLRLKNWTVDYIELDIGVGEGEADRPLVLDNTKHNSVIIILCDKFCRAPDLDGSTLNDSSEEVEEEDEVDEDWEAQASEGEGAEDEESDNPFSDRYATASTPSTSTITGSLLERSFGRVLGHDKVMRRLLITTGATAPFPELVQAVLEPEVLSDLKARNFTHITLQVGESLQYCHSLLPKDHQGLEFHAFAFKKDGLAKDMRAAVGRDEEDAEEGLLITHCGTCTSLSFLLQSLLMIE